MEGLGDFIKKISDGAKSFGTLIDNDNFKKSLDTVGTIGVLIKIGLDIYEQVKNELQTEEERAFYSFFKIAFESANESIIKENEEQISITQIKDKNVKEELFKTFTNIDEWNNYLPDHHTKDKFRSIICNVIKDTQNERLIIKNGNIIRDFI